MEKFNKRRFILKGSLTIEGYFEVYGNDKINLYNEYYKKFIGKSLEVLVETYSDGYLIGHLSNYGKVKFKCDEKEIEDDFLFGAISNSMSVGGIVKFKDSVVKLNDGKFEILLIKNPSSLIQLQSIVDGILRKDLNRNGIEFFHTNEITVTGGEDVAWTLDGEYSAGEESVTLTNIPSAIHLIVPADTNVK